MKNKRNGKHEKRIKKLAIVCTLCAVLLGVSTYAWFIGMRTVNVSGFDVNIATTESLYLSLNGKDWDYTVNINEENINDVDGGTVYEGNTNSWSELIPMSTVGKINATSNRLTLYEKGSFTATPGGYRIMASEVTNTGAAEEDGYVVFDLFIKNLSGEAYYANLSDNPMKDEEAIYLTTESAVTVADAGAGAEKTGIENSVRVAFAQIGRVEATTGADADAETYDADLAKIRGISCTTADNVTGICTRDATIWEPNDTKHVENAINWFATTCKKRTGADLTQSTSYGAACDAIADGTAYPAYAISGVIDETDQVDNYDGYNGYNTSIAPTATKGKLVKVDTFTDSEKIQPGNERKPFMYLAPNSITKVRVYIYLEGQDVDNYDFASLGKKITVNFGFTKERFNGEDAGQTGVELPDDVLATRTVEYTANVSVENISNPEVEFDANVFTVPREVMSFTFTDNDVQMIATYITATTLEEAHWDIQEVEEP